MNRETPPFASGGLPLLGHAWAYHKDRDALLRRGYEEQGPVFALRLVNQPVAVVVGPEYHATFFGETDHKLTMDKPYRFIRAIFGDLAFLSSPETYQKQRHIIHAPFRRTKMLAYARIMEERTRRWLDGLPDEGEMELTSAISHLVQDIAGYALMGKHFQESVGREFWDLYADLSAALDPLIPPHWPLPKFRRRDRAKARMVDILRPLIKERRVHPDEYDDFFQDFANAAYKDGTPLNDDEIISLVLGFNFAGHETTAGQAAWTIILLLQHPDYLARVREEIDTHLPADAPIDGEHMRQLSHILWALRETERMRPSADVLMRYVEEDVAFGDYVVPQGWLVQTTAAISHFLPGVFTNPEQYDPLRFAPGREEDKQFRFSLIGFGGGTHKCAGMNFANNEMMIITALLFRAFDIELLTPNPRILHGMGAARPSPTRVRFRRRKKAN